MLDFRVHISSLFLLLSLSLAFPVQYWHDCEAEQGDDHSVETNADLLEALHPDCQLCDLILPVLSVELALNAPLPPALIIVPEEGAYFSPLLFAYECPQLRAPPLRLS